MKKRYVYIVEHIEVNVDNGYLDNGQYYCINKETIGWQHFFSLKKNAAAYYSRMHGMNLRTYSETYYTFNRIRREEMK